MQCEQCNDIDLALIEYNKIDESESYEVTFECRQCQYQFTVVLSESELDNYR